MIGGVDHSRSGFNRAIDAHRQAGSSWKPFVYLTALEAGHTPDETVVDQPVTIDGWSPHDFEPTFLGQITLQTALAQSVNTVAANLADQVGRPNVANTARRLGILTQINTEPAMALGSSLVTPIEMAEAYDAFSNGGDRVQAWGIERVRLPGGGRVIWTHPAPQTPNVIGNPALSELNQMLRQVLVSGTGVNARIAGYDLAGKTGTASDYKDAWFCGFTGGLTTVVWMGRDDDTPMRGITGGSAPAEAWRGFMRVALRRTPTTAIPAGPPGGVAIPPPTLVATPSQPAPPSIDSLLLLPPPAPAPERPPPRQPPTDDSLPPPSGSIPAQPEPPPPDTATPL
jgi:penicillin-binding protein 1A